MSLCAFRGGIVMNDDENELKEHLKKISGQGVDLYLEGKPGFHLDKDTTPFPR